MVFKPAGVVPGSAWALADIISRAGLPESGFNPVMGSGSEIGQATSVRGVTFTGSVSTGRRIARDCVESGRKVQLELGGKNPLIVLDDTSSEIGPVASAEQLEQDLSYIKLGKEDGARLAYGGERLRRDYEGYYISPALFTETTNEMRVNREEIFGPVASVIRAKTYEDAVQNRQRHTVRPVVWYLHDLAEILP